MVLNNRNLYGTKVRKNTTAMIIFSEEIVLQVYSLVTQSSGTKWRQDVQGLYYPTILQNLLNEQPSNG